METTVLGRTGLTVSVMGLGGGGHSRLGLATGNSTAQAVAVVRRAVELGVTLLDTAQAYGTEPIIAEALHDLDRDALVIATKLPLKQRGQPFDASDFRRRVGERLVQLGIDTIDVLQLHGLALEDYDTALGEALPILDAAREAGKVRFLGVTEMFNRDTSHEMLHRALRDECWDVYMVGYNLLNPSAARTVFPRTKEKGIGTLDMFAVRRAFSQPDRLREILDELLERDEIDPAELGEGEPLAFLTAPGVADSLSEAAYRFCRHTDGMDVVLSGTGNLEHLEQNVQSLNRGPLPAEVLDRLDRLFGRVDSVTGQ